MRKSSKVRPTTKATEAVELQALVSQGLAKVHLGVELAESGRGRLRLYTQKDRSSYIEFKASGVLDQDELLLKSGRSIGVIVVLPADAEVTLKERKPSKIELEFLRGKIADSGLPLANGPNEAALAIGLVASTLPCATVICVTLIVCVPVSYQMCSHVIGCDTGSFVCELESALRHCPSHWCNTSLAVCSAVPTGPNPDDEPTGPVA